MNDAGHPDERTRRAKEAIGKDEPGSDWILRPEEHAAKLPPEAGALKRILTSDQCKRTQASYRAHDALANIAQARYKRAARRGLVATLIATLIGAVFLLPPLQSIPPELRTSATAAEYLLLFAAFLTARYLAVARPFPDWMKSRAEAELARIRIFDEVMANQQQEGPDELPLLPLKLEYFRRYQLEVQRRYYGGRGREHQLAAGHTRRWQRASLILSAVAALVATWAGIALVAYLLAYLQIPLPYLMQRLTEFNAMLPIDDDKWLLALGVGGSALYGFATSRSLMNLDERNASRYLTTSDNLNLLAGEALEAARNHAAAGSTKEVREFVERVQSLISSEHKEWISLREAVGES